MLGGRGGAIRAARTRGEETGLSDEEIAFYDALAQNESAREVMGEPALRVIAHELVEVIKSNVSIDWMHRTNARAKRFMFMGPFAERLAPSAAARLLLSANWLLFSARSGTILATSPTECLFCRRKRRPMAAEGGS
jgi:hypothetical protein